MENSDNNLVLETESQDENLPVLASLIFVAHPVFTSGVAYIFQRNGLLSTLFYLTAFYSLLRAFPIGQPVRKQWIVSSSGAYLLSTWSKEIGITFIAVAICFEWLFQPREGRKVRIRWYYPLVGVCLFSLFMVFWQMVRTPILKRTMYGDWSIWQNIFTQWNVVTEYMTLIFWPHPDRLSIDRDFPVALSIFDNGAWFSGLILAGILGFGFWARKRQRLMTFAIFWFFITLIPESTVIPISEVMVEYRLYLPGLGFVLVISLALKAFFESMGAKKYYLSGGGLILIVFAIFAFQRNIVMKEGFLVWQDAAQKNPYNIRAQTAYATYLKNEGQFKEALVTYRKAVELNEMKLPFKLPMMQPHNELGVYLTEQGEWKKAKDQFIAALKISRWFVPALENLTAVMERTQESHYEKNYLNVFEEVDYFPQGHYNLGNFYLRNRQYKKAVAQFEIALHQKQNFYEAYNNMGTAFVQMGERGKARLLFEKALEVNPDFKSARDNLTALLAPQNEIVTP